MSAMSKGMLHGYAYLFAFAAATVMTGVARAAGEHPAAAAPAAATSQPHETEQRMRQDMQSMLSHLAESGALGQHPEQISLQVNEPARRISNLGALVDSTSAQNARDGLHVLGATPGSTADRLGLHPGDVIVAVNGTSLRDLGADERGRALAAVTMRDVVDGIPDAASIEVDVLRAGSVLALTAPMQAVYLPAVHMQLGTGAEAARAAVSTAAAASAESAGCGRISEFDVAPRGERLYAARILLIDGNTPGPQGSPSFRVEAGEHKVVVAENIPTQALGVGEIATLRKHTSKPLNVVVQPGMTAMVAAQFHPANASDLNRGTYWDPVVWRQIAEPCK